MQNQNHSHEEISGAFNNLPAYLAEIVQVGYRKYQELDEISARLDTTAREINQLRSLIEHDEISARLDTMIGEINQLRSLIKHDEISARLDTMTGETNQLRSLIEQKINDLDRLFTFPPD